MSAPRFHFHNPAVLRLFACVACQKDMVVIAPKFFGVSTMTTLCASCVQALLKKWPDAFQPPAEATP